MGFYERLDPPDDVDECECEGDEPCEIHETRRCEGVCKESKHAWSKTERFPLSEMTQTSGMEWLCPTCIVALAGDIRDAEERHAAWLAEREASGRAAAE